MPNWSRWGSFQRCSWSPTRARGTGITTTKTRRSPVSPPLCDRRFRLQRQSRLQRRTAFRLLMSGSQSWPINHRGEKNVVISISSLQIAGLRDAHGETPIAGTSVTPEPNADEASRSRKLILHAMCGSAQSTPGIPGRSCFWVVFRPAREEPFRHQAGLPR